LNVELQRIVLEEVYITNETRYSTTLLGTSTTPLRVDEIYSPENQTKKKVIPTGLGSD